MKENKQAINPSLYTDMRITWEKLEEKERNWTFCKAFIKLSKQIAEGSIVAENP